MLYTFLASLANSAQEQAFWDGPRMSHWLGWAVNSSQFHAPSAACRLPHQFSRYPSLLLCPAAQRLSQIQDQPSRWRMLHASQWISLQEERGCFQTRSCGFTCAGRWRRLSLTALQRCCAPCRLSHCRYCREETSPFWGCFVCCFFFFKNTNKPIAVELSLAKMITPPASLFSSQSCKD